MAQVKTIRFPDSKNGACFRCFAPGNNVPDEEDVLPTFDTMRMDSHIGHFGDHQVIMRKIEGHRFVVLLDDTAPKNLDFELPEGVKTFGDLRDHVAMMIARRDALTEMLNDMLDAHRRANTIRKNRKGPF